MRPEPAACRSVTCLTAHTLGRVGLGALLRRRVERVTRQAFLFAVRPADAEKLRHAKRHGVVQHLGGSRVLILHDPGRVFGLQDAAAGDRPHAAVAARCRARSRPRVASNCGCLLRGPVRRCTLCEGGSTLSKGGSSWCEDGCETRCRTVQRRKKLGACENDDHENRQACGAWTTHEADIVYAGDHGAAVFLSASLSDLR